MEEVGTKVLLKRSQKHKSVRVHPQEIKTENAHSEGGPQIEVPDVNDQIEEMESQEQALSVKEILPQFQSKSERQMQGKVLIFNEKREFLGNGFIVLYQQLISVYERHQNKSKLLHQQPFPNGAEYNFFGNSMVIYEKNGKFFKLQDIEKQLWNDMFMEWLSTKNIFTDFKILPLTSLSDTDSDSDFKMEQVEDNFRDDLDEKNYSLKFNHPSFREIYNIYNRLVMKSSLYYPIVDGKPQIKNAIEFLYFYRPNRLITSNEWEFDEEIEDHMSDENRKCIQWAPSRDWSRLFVLSSLPDDDNDMCLNFYVEFYDFINEKQAILPSPLRINFLSQLFRPQWI